MDSDERSENGFGFALPDDPRQRDRLAELGSIAGGLVHELKNPLGAIALNVELLLDAYAKGDPQPERSKARLQRIQAGTNHLQDIVQSFLSFARPGRPDVDKVDISQLLHHIVDEQRDLLNADRISIAIRVAPDLAAVPGDSGQLRSIFLNIILNARDALRDDPRPIDRQIIIAARNRRHGIRVVIANNGPALNSTAAAHLFDPFFSAKDGGTGLGLAIVARLVELHRGRVTASSNPDQGVSFTIELPTTLGPAQHRTELPAPDAGIHPDAS
ncbi:MAG: sensor histidine kinase [Planctomycetota bacterium]|nr:MAG: sensor histidine kinase [Planctomycetota bacterium]